MDLDFALELTARIAKEVKPLLGRRDSMDFVPLGNDLRKMRLDAEAAKATRSLIEESGESCHLVSEEWGHLSFGADPKTYLIVDEFDGTLNGTRGIPFAAVSIAISRTSHLQDIHTSLVYDIFRDVTYHAVRGKGAHRNGIKVRTSDRMNLHDCIMSIKVAASTKECLDRLAPLLVTADHGRDFGAAALELAMLASGQLDAMIDLRGRTRVTDVAAGFMLLKEAGGELHILNATDVNLRPGERVSFVAASGREVLNQLLRIVGI